MPSSSRRPGRAACRVVGVTAPAGYGKSTLLAEWARAEDRRVAWVSLDRFDDDPAALLALLASAYARVVRATPTCRRHGRSRRVGAGTGGAAPGGGVPGQPGSVRAHARRPARAAVAGLPRRARAWSSRGSRQARSWSRPVAPSSPTWPGCELRVTRWSSWRATWPSTRPAPRRSSRQAHVDLTPEPAAAVTARTEGWPVGLYLAAVIARDSRR